MPHPPKKEVLKMQKKKKNFLANPKNVYTKSEKHEANGKDRGNRKKAIVKKV